MAAKRLSLFAGITILSRVSTCLALTSVGDLSLQASTINPPYPQEQGYSSSQQPLLSTDPDHLPKSPRPQEQAQQTTSDHGLGRSATSKLESYVGIVFESLHAADVKGEWYVELPLGVRLAVASLASSTSPLSSASSPGSAAAQQGNETGGDPYSLPRHPLFARIVGTHSVLTTFGASAGPAHESISMTEGKAVDTSTSAIVERDEKVKSVICVAYPRKASHAAPSLFAPQHASLRRRWHAGVGGAFAAWPPRRAGTRNRFGWLTDTKPDVEGEGEGWPDETRPVWWTAQDGRVNFEDSRERWWLLGMEVGAYECF